MDRAWIGISMSKPVIGGIEGIPQEQFNTLVERVLQAISVADSPLTEGELLEGVSGKKQYKVKIVRYCNDKCLISRTGTGKKGDPFLYSKVTSEPPPTPEPWIGQTTKPYHEELDETEFDNLVELFRILHTIKTKAS